MATAQRGYYERMIHRTIALLEQHYGRRCPMPRVVWDLRGKSTLGQAFGTNKIRMNEDYRKVLPASEFVRVAIHEACHTFTNSRRPATASRRGDWRPHGREWQDAMRAVGQDPARLFDPTVQVPAARRPTHRSIFS